MSVRRGRVTPAQRRALDTLLEQYDVHQQPLSAESPLGVEIGFGMGEALADWALAEPEWQLLGIEIYPSGVGALLNRLQAQGSVNVRVAQEPAEQVVEGLLAPASVSEFRILFPDPWPKKRHIKRRLLQPDFVSLLSTRLVPGGSLYVATDWAPYAEWALEMLSGEPTLENSAGTEGYIARDDRRVVTKFEARGLRLGHDIYDLHFTRRET